MFIKLQREQALITKLSIVGIWLYALILLGAAVFIAYQTTQGVHWLQNPYLDYALVAFMAILGIGLLVGSRVARAMVLFSTYFSLITTLMLFIADIATTKEFGLYDTTWLQILNLSISLMIVYIFSNKEAIKLYRIKHPIREMTLYFSLSLLIVGLYALLLYQNVYKTKIAYPNEPACTANTEKEKDECEREVDEFIRKLGWGGVPADTQP